LGLLAQAQPWQNSNDPITFFTSAADCLLKHSTAEWLANDPRGYVATFATNGPFGVGQIPVKIGTNFTYTPSVHRLLQLAANLYDATTNRADAFGPLPTVFHPVLRRDGTNVFITGFIEVAGDSTPWLHQPLDLREMTDIISVPPVGTPVVAATPANVPNAYGVPWILGARKGLPSFNEFAFQSVFQITRKLQITRPAKNSPISAYQTNQMYILGISNVLAAEFWNSYRSNHTRPVEIVVADRMSLALTNSDGLNIAYRNFVVAGSLSLPSQATNVWPGYAFLIPLSTNLDFPRPCIYQQSTHTLTTNFNVPFETGQGFPLPQWGVAVANRLVCIIRDRDTKQLLDYVQLSGLDNVRNLNAEMNSQSPSQTGWDALWNTNRRSGSFNVLTPQYGVIAQISISLGGFNANSVDWTDYGFQPAGQTKKWAIDNFRAFFHLAPLFYQDFEGNTNLMQEVPFSPSLKLSRYCTWQANDPLVHYMPADLQYFASANELVRESVKAGVVVYALENIGRMNDRYEPWGYPFGFPGVTAYQPAVKDPLVRSSDDWYFPDAEPLGLTMLGRVHRGTPWQTLYLKSALVASSTWQKWTGNFDGLDASHTMPAADWRLASLLAALLNTNRVHELASANQPATANWLPVLDQIEVWTNRMSDQQVRLLQALGGWPRYDLLTMTADSPQAALLAKAIARTRTSQPRGYFRDPGDMLATPELTLASPWLNRTSTLQLQQGLTDAAYEIIPSQLLARLRPDSLGAAALSGGLVRVQFTAFDDAAYAVEVSSNLLDWLPVRTNSPTNGVFEFAEPLLETGMPRFYRSVNLP